MRLDTGRLSEPCWCPTTFFALDLEAAGVTSLLALENAAQGELPRPASFWWLQFRRRFFPIVHARITHFRGPIVPAKAPAVLQGTPVGNPQQSCSTGKVHP